MNAIEMLVEQHREMEAALKGVAEAGDGARRPRFLESADVLMSHLTIEEEHFYPAVRAKRTEEILLEGLEEHLSLKRLIADLLALAEDDEHFDPKFHVLKEQAEHHHEEEEEKLFPKVARLMSPQELERLGATMEAAQAELLRGRPRELAAEQTDAAASLRQ